MDLEEGPTEGSSSACRTDMEDNRLLSRLRIIFLSSITRFSLRWFVASTMGISSIIRSDFDFFLSSEIPLEWFSYHFPDSWCFLTDVSAGFRFSLSPWLARGVPSFWGGLEPSVGRLDSGWIWGWGGFPSSRTRGSCGARSLTCEF